MKAIRDYIHFYLGCDAITVKLTPERIDGHMIDLVRHGYYYAKPILRPLDCTVMTHDEMAELLALQFHPSDDIFRNMIDEFIFHVDELKRQVKHGEGVGYSTFKDGSHYQSGTLSFSSLNPAQFTFLLSKHFDLFGLIEAGLAVDRTKLLVV